MNLHPREFHRRTSVPSAAQRPDPRPLRYRYVKRRWKVLFRALDLLSCALPSRLLNLPVRHAANWPPRRILLVQLDHIGDAVLSSSIPAVLKRAFPATEIHALCSPWAAQVFETLPAVDRLEVASKNWHARRAREFSLLPAVVGLARRIRRGRYDLGVDLRGDFPTIVALWLAGVPVRVGLDCAGGGRLLTHAANWDPLAHELENRWHTLRLILPECSLRDLAPKVPLRDRDVALVRRRLEVARARRPIIVVHVSAGTMSKRWPTQYYHELISEIYDSFGATCILVGARSDTSVAYRLEELGTPALNWVGAINLPQLAALAAEADAFVGPDSGPAHIAATVGTKTIVLFSGTNRSSQWMPVGPHVIPLACPTPCAPCARKTCPVPGHPCMAGIMPDLVARILARVLHDEASRTTADPQQQRPSPLAASKAAG